MLRRSWRIPSAEVTFSAVGSTPWAGGPPGARVTGGCSAVPAFSATSDHAEQRVDRGPDETGSLRIVTVGVRPRVDDGDRGRCVDAIGKRGAQRVDDWLRRRG